MDSLLSSLAYCQREIKESEERIEYYLQESKDEKHNDFGAHALFECNGDYLDYAGHCLYSAHQSRLSIRDNIWRITELKLEFDKLYEPERIKLFEICDLSKTKFEQYLLQYHQIKSVLKHLVEQFPKPMMKTISDDLKKSGETVSKAEKDIAIHLKEIAELGFNDPAPDFKVEDLPETEDLIENLNYFKHVVQNLTTAVAEIKKAKEKLQIMIQEKDRKDRKVQKAREV